MTYKHQPEQIDNLVVFAGAGCSMAPPSSLPGWYALNDAILDALWDRIEAYNINIGFREKILPSIKKSRNENKFPPDYQAQLMAERVGINYFNLLSAVDAETFNPVQYYTAILAKKGLVQAVVTTNFDQNFERAFDAIGVSYQTFYDEKGFKSMNSIEKDTVPIIKIHGTCAVPESMIDTRKQRLKGRSAALQTALLHLLRKHHFFFAGFSGEDFDDNDNYLGFRSAASTAKGFTYLCFPGSKVRQSMKDLIDYYGNDKATSIESDPAVYFEKLAKISAKDFQTFHSENIPTIGIKDKLASKINDLQPMDAINMLTALAESYGDEISARFLYDKTWKNRLQTDYKGDGLSRFLLNYGRSFVFNFQDRMERASSAGVAISSLTGGQTPEGAENYFANPARQNMHHVENTSPETAGLIGLTQTYMGNPIIFSEFPESLAANISAKPTSTELADIIYYYSFYAVIYVAIDKGLTLLSHAIIEMEEEHDEPRISQLLSRRALIKFRAYNKEMLQSGEEDAIRAKSLAEKYHEPSLIALANMALAAQSRAANNFSRAHELIQQSIETFSGLFRIPQLVECYIENVKIIMLGFQDDKVDKGLLLQEVQDIIDRANALITERIHVFEPEYCYLIGMVYINYTNASKSQYLPWFSDALSFARQYKQERNFNFFKETCHQLNILKEVEAMVQNSSS